MTFFDIVIVKFCSFANVQKKQSRHNFVYYPEFRQIACQKPTEIPVTICRSLIAVLSLFPTHEYTDR